MRREKMLLKNQKDAQCRQGLDNGWVCRGEGRNEVGGGAARGYTLRDQVRLAEESNLTVKAGAICRAE